MAIGSKAKKEYVCDKSSHLSKIKVNYLFRKAFFLLLSTYRYCISCSALPGFRLLSVNGSNQLTQMPIVHKVYPQMQFGEVIRFEDESPPALKTG